MCAWAAAGCSLRRHILGSPQLGHQRGQPALEPSRVRLLLCVIHNSHASICISKMASFQLARYPPARAHSLPAIIGDKDTISEAEIHMMCSPPVQDQAAGGLQMQQQRRTQ